MRVRIKLQPLAYPAAIPTTHHQYQAFIYEMVDAVNPQLARSVHNQGWPVAAEYLPAQQFKLFVFSVPEAPRGFQFRADEKVFESGTVFWQIASSHEVFITSLIAGLATHKNVRIGRTQFVVEELQIVPTPEFTREMRFIALSPLVASTAEKRPDGRLIKCYLRDEMAFAEAIVQNLRKKYVAIHGQAPDDAEFEFAFDGDYLRRAGGFDSRKVTRLASFIKRKPDGSAELIQIRGIQAPFIVRGASELIQIGWECGFGEANSQGFGMAGWGSYG